MQVESSKHPLVRLFGPRKVLAGLAIVAMMAVALWAGNADRASAGFPSNTAQVFSVQTKVSQPADRMDISFGKPNQDLKVGFVFGLTVDSFIKGVCFGFPVTFPPGHQKDVNPPPLVNHEVWTLLFDSKCLQNFDEVGVIAFPVDPSNHLVIKNVTLYNTNGTRTVFTDDIRVGSGNAKKLDWGKIPRLSNLFLCTEPTEFPQCNIGFVAQVLGQPITSPDPKCAGFPNFFNPADCPRQELGAFETEIRFDSKLVDVFLVPALFLFDGTRATTCFENNRQGIANLACVTKGKEFPIPAPNVLALAVIIPKPDVYSLLIANQLNGIATQLINQGCNLADLQGHPIPVEGLDVCQDGAVTIRFLEGDVHADCVVDVLDQQQISFRWGSRLGNLLYNQRFDLEPSQPKKGDGDIDAKDLQMVYGRHGSTCHDPHPDQHPVDPKGKPTATPTHTNTPTPTPTDTPTPTPTATATSTPTPAD